jgi:hypothetical protein
MTIKKAKQKTNCAKVSEFPFIETYLFGLKNQTALFIRERGMEQQEQLILGFTVEDDFVDDDVDTQKVHHIIRDEWKTENWGWNSTKKGLLAFEMYYTDPCIQDSILQAHTEDGPIMFAGLRTERLVVVIYPETDDRAEFIIKNPTWKSWKEIYKGYKNF